MARIRSIKPEFPQSESVGRLSRDARLCFILLWTLADDSGRLRGNSRMLASLLYPYDDDAPKLMDKWLTELDAEGCTRRYKIGGDTYIEIVNWLKHQKIDKPSASKIPGFDESSRILSNPLEHSCEDRRIEGSRIKEGNGSKDHTSARKSAPIEFEELKRSYPKRAGDQGWQKAVKACNARLVDGYTWDEMLTGTRRYQAFCVATGKVGTEFVKQASTFFGPDKHFLASWDLPASKAEIVRDQNVDVSLKWLEKQNAAG